MNSGWTILPKKIFDIIKDKCPNCGSNTDSKMKNDNLVSVRCPCGWGEDVVLESLVNYGIAKTLEYKPEETFKMCVEAYERNGTTWSCSALPGLMCSVSIPSPMDI